jgi:hypothetical protein
MPYWHPSVMQAFGGWRAEQLMREAEDWRAARLAAQSAPQRRGGLARALAWWRARLPHRRAVSAPLAEQEQA